MSMDGGAAGLEGHSGWVERGFDSVQAAFAEVVQTQPGTGAAVAVWLDGRWLVDLWGGAADASGGHGWGRESIVQPYSVTKPFVAVCALRLVERGELELDAVVQRYWPEFTARATVRQLLAHQAGVVALDAPAGTDLFYDWDAMCSRLAAQPPAWEPGTAHGESALFYGHLVGELVRRIDGRGIGRFLREEVCAPLGLDFAIGLGPTDQARAVEITGLDEAFRVPGAGQPELYRRAVTNPPGARDGAVVNSPRWRAAEIPAINGHGTARAIAGFYAALLEGRLLAPTLLAEATSVHASGIDQVFGEHNAFGLGFGVDADGFGMGGLGGSYGGASREGYAIAFVTGSMGSHDRAINVENALRTCLDLPALVD
jgi:CubicO group peptidase (beta-lactamase class C family)